MGKPERSSVLPAIPWVMSSAGWAGIDLLQFAAGQADPDAEPGGDDQKPPIIADPVRLDRRRWAMLIKRIYQADPLLCPKCGGTTYEVDPDFLEFARREQTSQPEPP